MARRERGGRRERRALDDPLCRYQSRTLIVNGVSDLLSSRHRNGIPHASRTAAAADGDAPAARRGDPSERRRAGAAAVRRARDAACANPIASMPGVAQLSVDRAGGGVPRGRRSRHPGGDPLRHPRAQGRRRLGGVGGWRGRAAGRRRRSRRRCPSSWSITDVCLCEYTDHGHCGVVRGRRGRERSDARAARPRRRSRTPAPGPTWWRPSDMMDGRVGAIRAGLDAAGFADARRSWRTPPSTRRRSTGPSATPPSRRRSSATGAATRWIPPTRARRSARSRSTSRRAPTSSW